MIFANLEVIANANVLNHLANVRVVIADATVPGIFDRPAAVANLGAGAADTSPTLTVASSAVMVDPVGQLVHIAGVPYVIVAASPDGTGLTTLSVECVQ